jgi:hypothetical protein
MLLSFSLVISNVNLKFETMKIDFGIVSLNPKHFVNLNHVPRSTPHGFQPNMIIWLS